MKYETIITSKTGEQILSTLSRRGVRIRKGSTEQETRFLAKRGHVNEFFRFGFTFLVVGSVRKRELGSEIKFCIVPGLGSLIVLFVSSLSLVLSGVSLIQNVGLSHKAHDSLFLVGLFAFINIILFTFFFCLKKETRDNLLLRLNETEALKSGMEVEILDDTSEESVH